MSGVLAKRHDKMINVLAERGEMSVSSLVSELEVSEATVRRDLANLEADGRLVRTLGGARPMDDTSFVARTFGQKREAMREAKEKIARTAVAMVEPGMSLALDSGTTVWRIAAALKDKAPLTIFTSALAPIEELGMLEGISVYCLGGRFRYGNLDFVGLGDGEFFSRFHADIAFLGADALIPGRGVFSADQTSASIIAAMGGCSDRCVVVADHTKIGGKGLFLGLRREQIDTVVTDAGLSDRTRAELGVDPYEVVIAQ